jgi:hypothetical protein
MGPKSGNVQKRPQAIAVLQRDLKLAALERDWRRRVRKKDPKWGDWNRRLRKNDPQSAVLQKDSIQAALPTKRERLKSERREVELKAPKTSLNSPP